MKSALLNAAETSEMITMLLPARGRNVLIPNLSVAEITRLEGLRRVNTAPGWLRGMASWRGQDIPVLSFEAINDDPFVASDVNLRAAVIYGAVDGDELPFYALASTGTPRLMRISAEEIVRCQGAETGPAELMVANAGGEEVGIPDLPWIEQQVLGVRPLLNA